MKNNKALLLASVLIILVSNVFAGGGKKGEVVTDSAQAAAKHLEDSIAAAKPLPISIGFDIVSRYNWRGFDYGLAPNIQPSLTYTFESKVVGFDIGTWASYSFTGSFAEIDFFANLYFPHVWVGVVDYYYPTETTSSESFYDFSRSTTHTFEALIGVDGPDKVPFSVMFGYNFYSPSTDPDNSMYFEISYPLSLRKGVDMSFFAGAAYGGYYTTNGNFKPINIGLNISREFSIKNKVALPMSISVSTNPDTQKFFVIASVGLYNKG